MDSMRAVQQVPAYLAHPGDVLVLGAGDVRVLSSALVTRDGIAMVFTDDTSLVVPAGQALVRLHPLLPDTPVAVLAPPTDQGEAIPT